MHRKLTTFTDRLEAIELFDMLRGRDTDQPWPLLPILAFIAPSGSGKSMLIDYLRVTRCCLPDGQVAIPHAYMDFTIAETPKNPLMILVALRNQLQQCYDGQGKHLVFPRFDLGAAIALATYGDEKLPLLELEDVQRSLSAHLPFFGEIGEMGNALGNAIPVIPPLLVGLKWISQIPALQTLLQRLEKGAGWRWYLTHGSDIGIHANANIRDVLSRLYSMATLIESDQQDREFLIEYLLPEAFIADLRDVLNNSGAWSSTTNVVLFLDGFDALLSDTGRRKGLSLNRGIRLLEMLTITEHRKRGETDPLLLVIGSNQRLIDRKETRQHPSFEQQTLIMHEYAVRHQAQQIYQDWCEQLPRKKNFLRLRDLYMPIWLHDFGIADTGTFLSRLDIQDQLGIFDEAVIEVIHRSTHGHPFYLSLTAAAILESRDRGLELKQSEFDHALVSPTLVRGHEEETIRDFLLALFLRQLPKDEIIELIFCAVPRAFDTATLRILLQLKSDIEARDRWNRFCLFTFTRVIDEKRIVFHPSVRDLLLQELIPDDRPDSDYSLAHSHLKEHFQRCARDGDELAWIEVTYHALALGDPEPAIKLALTALIHHRLDLFQLLLEVVDQAPTGLMPPNIMERASEALSEAMFYHKIEDHVTALILYIWLGSASRGDLNKTTNAGRTSVRIQKEVRL